MLSVLAIVPLAALLSHGTEAVAAKTGDAAGGLLNATLGNLTELVIALSALRAGQYVLVKASVAVAEADSASVAEFTRTLSVGLAVLLIVGYALGMLFSLRRIPNCLPALHMPTTPKGRGPSAWPWPCWSASRCWWRW